MSVLDVNRRRKYALYARVTLRRGARIALTDRDREASDMLDSYNSYVRMALVQAECRKRLREC